MDKRHNHKKGREKIGRAFTRLETDKKKPAHKADCNSPNVAHNSNHPHFIGKSLLYVEQDGQMMLQREGKVFRVAVEEVEEE